LKTLLVDLDGILADLTTSPNGWYDRYNAMHPDNVLTQENVVEWDIKNARHTKDLFKVLSEPGLFRGLSPLAGSQEGLKALYIYIVTAATATTYTIKEKLEWLDEHFDFMDRRHFIAAYNKSLIRGDFLIDDGPHNIEDWLEANNDGKVVTIDYPYNRDINPRTALRVTRTYGYRDTHSAWEQIVRELKAL
jgi:5'-nucleotidase